MFDSLPDFPLEKRWREQMWPGPIVVAVIKRMVLAVPLYLLIQRNGATYNGQWALVGGKWDFGETLMTAVTREVKEETSLDTTFTALRGIVSERMVSPDEDGRAAHFLIFVCELAAVAGAAREQSEGAVTWFSRAEIDDLHAQNAIIPSDYAMLKQFADSVEAAPHFEVEMLSASDGDEQRPSRLVRFDRINRPETD